MLWAGMVSRLLFVVEDPSNCGAAPGRPRVSPQADTVDRVIPHVHTRDDRAADGRNQQHSFYPADTAGEAVGPGGVARQGGEETDPTGDRGMAPAPLLVGDSVEHGHPVQR